jgi:hypothetical protein
VKVTCDEVEIKEYADNQPDGYGWKNLQIGRVLQITHHGKEANIFFR